MGLSQDITLVGARVTYQFYQTTFHILPVLYTVSFDKYVFFVLKLLSANQVESKSSPC